MTLRTTSATLRKVVSRSSDVANTSATSSSSDSTGNRSGLDRSEPTFPYDSSRVCGLALDSKMFEARALRDRCTGDPYRLLPGHHAYVRKIAVFFRVVQAISHDKLVWNLESNVVAFQWKLASRRLVEQGRHLQGPRLPGIEHPLQIGHRQPGIEDVFNENDVLVLDGLVNVFRELYLARRVPATLEFLARCRAVAVTGDSDEVECCIQIDHPGEIGQENRRALQYSDKNHRLPGKILRDLRAEFAHTPGNVLPRNQHLEF